jgi:hypothetical protein
MVSLNQTLNFLLLISNVQILIYDHCRKRQMKLINRTYLEPNRGLCRNHRGVDSPPTYLDPNIQPLQKTYRGVGRISWNTLQWQVENEFLK